MWGRNASAVGFGVSGVKAEIGICIYWILLVDLHETVDPKVIIIEEDLLEYRLAHHEKSW